MIARSPAFINALKDREIDLRGNKIAVIENLAATQNQFDSIDLSDNEISKLECMAVLPRIQMLLLHNNRINRFADNLARAFPNLKTLVLTNNQLVTLKELEPLAQLKTLTSLSLNDNLVTKQKGYRSFVIALLPKLRVLDFQKVKLAERKEAQASLKRQRTAAAAESAPNKASKGAPEAEAASSAPKAGPTPEQIAKIKAAIGNASSLEEVAKLEKALKAGDYDAVLAATGGDADGAAAAEPAPAEAGASTDD